MKGYWILHTSVLAGIFALLSACGGSSASAPGPGASEPRINVSTSAGGSASTRDLAANESVSFTPDEGFYLDEVTGCPGTLDGLTFTASPVATSCTLTVNFARHEYTVSVTTTAGGTVDDDNLLVLHGESPQIAIHPDSDYRIASAQGCPGQLQDVVYTLAPVETECDLAISFEPRPAVQGDIVLRVEGQAVKKLLFEWEPQPWAHEYRLYESHNGVDFEQLVQIEGDASRHEEVVPIHLQADAVYRVEACSYDICEYSEAVAIANAEEAIGLLVPGDYTDQEAFNFGGGIALSGDGSVLVASLRVDGCGIMVLSGDLLNDPQEQCLDWPVGYSNIELSHDGSVIAISDATEEGSGGERDAGAVSIYAKGDAEWALVDTLQPEIPIEHEYFGASMAISGDGSRLVVGGQVVYCADCSPAFHSASTNRAFFYERGGNQWELKQIIKDESSRHSDYFGTSLSMSADGNWLTLGAQGDAGNTGKFYTYQYNEGAWQERWQTPSPSDGTYQFFGRVTLSANGKALFAIGGGSDYRAEIIYEYLMGDDGWELVNTIDPLGFGELGFGAYKPAAVSENGEYLVLTYEKNHFFYEEAGDDRYDWVAEGRGTVIVMSKQDDEWQEKSYLSLPYANEWQVYGFLPVGLSLDAEILAVGVGLGDGVREVEEDFVYNPDSTSTDVPGEIYLF